MKLSALWCRWCGLPFGTRCLFACTAALLVNATRIAWMSLTPVTLALSVVSAGVALAGLTVHLYSKGAS